ncbi:MAG: hypothetical protein M3463_15445, partial [Verrucomicrobiota bacterium]|nr:hypothetical protein [Verrucomicrobiota bacterium]
QGLRALREEQTQQVKAKKQSAVGELQRAAASPQAAAAAWEEAVRTVQFEGAAKEGSQFREWKDNEGQALGEKEVQNAAFLHLRWLSITLQRANGAPVKDLLSTIVQFTKDVTAAEAAMEVLEENLKKDQERAERADRSTPNRRGPRPRGNEGQVKRMFDQILNRPVTGSVVAQALKVHEMLKVDKWEFTPGAVDGIFLTIVLPELRAAKDPRLLDYWDMKIQREAQAIAKNKTQYEVDKFNQVRKPELLWNRSQEFIVLGQRNRAIGEMFALIKSNPTHPKAGEWISRLEAVLMPPASPVTGTNGAVPAGTASAPQ